MIRMLIAAAALTLTATVAPAAQVTFYQLPPGAYPHDVAPAADGSVWFSGQRDGFAGRFDPKTGMLEKIALGNSAAPHGVIVGPDGNAWLTEGGQNAIARVDAMTKQVKLFPLPTGFADANLNTLVFDNSGMVWYTGQNGVHGRLDPKSGKLDAWKSPKGRGLYGITTTPAGEIWFASLAGDYIARVDSKGMLWVSFWSAGGIGRYDPVARLWTTYQMPQSRSGTYSIYVDDKDRVWATDWMANAIQRFDPQTETFSTFPSDRKGANVRQMLGRPGEAWGGESGTDRLVVIRD